MSNDLYKSLITYYGEYTKFIAEEKTTNDCSLTLFGVSGAGKSTFLSRLKSTMRPHDFYESVILREKEMITVEDVTIGNSISSVTIVPRLHEIGKLAIYDVPGFKDTDDNKKIIINILHKCLLNHVKQNKFIAVLRLHLLEETRMTQLISDYYDSFAQLFGENYRKNIDNVYFVITHYDKHESLSIKDVVKLMKERIFSSLDLNKQDLAYFLKRLVQKHILVDYKKDTQDDLLHRFDELLNDEKKSITKEDMTITNLDVYENELNKKLKKDVDDLTKQIIDDSTKNLEELKKQKESVESVLKEKSENTFKRDQVSGELDVVNNFLQNVDSGIDLITKKNEAFEFEKKLLISDAASQQNVLGVFDKTLREEVIINVRADVSKRTAFGGYYLENIMNIDQSLYKERVILITKHETNDSTLRTYLNTGSIIPDDIKKIKQFQSDLVLYNNNTCLRHGITVDPKYDEHSKELSIYVKCDVPFKFYFYYTQEMNQSLVFEKTKRHFTNIINFNENKANHITKQIEQNIHEINTIKLKDAGERVKREELLYKQTDLNNKIKEYEQKLEDANKLINETCDKHVRYLSNIKNTDLYVTANKILRIFNSNQLKSDVNEKITYINKYVEETIQARNNFKKSILLLQK